MVATFSGCVVVTHWLSHTRVQNFFRLVLQHKKVWYYLSSLSIQIGVLLTLSYNSNKFTKILVK